MTQESPGTEPVPEGWHPDPSGDPHLRWWDGRQWTEHVAPIPETASTTAADGYTEPLPPRQKAMTGATWAVLAITVLVVGGTGAGLWWGAASAQAEVEAEAPAVLDGFLSAATQGDTTWVDYVSPQLAASAPAAPLLGDIEAAKLIEMTIEAHAGPLSYGTNAVSTSETATGADTARSVVDLTYTYTVDGERQTASATQTIWLARPFYYGDDQPAEAEDGRTPTSIGPWRVAAVDVSTPGQLGDRELLAENTYATSTPPVTKCRMPQAALIDLAETARLRGQLGSACVNDDGRIAVGEGVDPTALAVQFPTLNSQTPLTEVTSLVGSADVPAPLAEMRLAVGSNEYVFVYAATGVDGQRTSASDVRLIAISKAESR